MAEQIPRVKNWRKSTFSYSSDCVELGETTDGRIAIRNSTDPEGGSVVFTRREIEAFLRGVVAGEFSDFALTAPTGVTRETLHETIADAITKTGRSLVLESDIARARNAVWSLIYPAPSDKTEEG